MLGSKAPDPDAVRARLEGLTPRWVPTEADLPAPPLEASGEPGEPAAASVVGLSGRATRAARRHLVASQDRPRWRVDASAARGLLSLALASAVGALAVVVWGWPRGEVSGPEPAAHPADTSSNVLVEPSSGTEASSARIVVDVDGEVRRPGVVRLPTGARVVDAIRAAGGLTARGDTGALNLAEILTDGQQVVVLAGGEPAQPAGPAASDPSMAPTTTATAAPVSLNSATAEQLETLPGIGPVLAAAIIEWRTQNGGFTSLEQLQDVSGIGPTTFAELAPLVRL